MSDKNLVEKIRRINQEKEEEHKNLICQRERNTKNVCCRLANIGGGSHCTFQSCKSNTTSNSISEFFFKL